MQPILIAKDHTDLYSFLNALVEAKQTIIDEPTTNLNETANEPQSVLIWSSEAHSTLFDSLDKLEMVEHYARKLDVKISLSSAADLQLRNWGDQLGWQVLWQIKGLDEALTLAASQTQPGRSGVWSNTTSENFYDQVA